MSDLKKTKVFILVFLAVSSAAVICANPRAINFSRFPSAPALESRLDEFFELYYDKVSHWVPEWTFDVTKDKVIGFMKTFVGEIDAFCRFNPENIDLLLFRGLLEHYLYNLDVSEYFEISEADFQALKNKFPNDYRPVWLLGNLYSYAALAFKAMHEFNLIVSSIPLERLDPYFLLDYASACSFAGMTVHGIQAIEVAAKIFKIRDEDIEDEIQLYRLLKDRIKEPGPDAEITGKDLVGLQQRETNRGLLSRLFGIWMPFEPSWKAMPLGFTSDTKTGAVVFVGIPFRSKKGKNITASIAVTFTAAPATTFEKYIDQMLAGLKDGKKKTVKKVDKFPANLPFLVYEWFDPDQYKEIGGAHGYAVFLKRSEPKVKGLAIEGAQTIISDRDGDDEGGLHYYRFEPEFTRFDGDIYYFIILDTCEEIFGESREMFLGFLDALLFD